MENINSETHSPVTEDGVVISQNNSILLQNNITQECLYVPITIGVLREFGLVEEFSHSISEQHKEQENETKIWTTENTLFLIDIVEKFDKEFASGIKKNVWEKVTQQCKHLHKNINEKQCETKWKTLKRYKTVLLHNNTSGQKKRYWEFFDVMHDIMHNKPEITPDTVCSSMTGLHVNKEVAVPDLSPCSSKEDKENENISNKDYESSFSRKRKAKMSEADRRHQEKMKRLDNFNDLFQKMIDKM
ncbi:hypothetical protein NQ314_003641 [Rhamnusium bicolor]|uniref:Myb-like domain-containing protein n=1 Tax=Rhamnusium bicolor TaxID=1586634 RepID=A0AAV8ZLL0_9CUCU|nr:hypothetical protein NQ314_003641 [Rhamnusium bicolor]